jgi:hypothetical protein
MIVLDVGRYAYRVILPLNVETTGGGFVSLAFQKTRAERSVLRPAPMLGAA